MIQLHFEMKSMSETIYWKTIDRFRLSWNNYNESDKIFLRGEEIKQKYLHELFLRDDH